MSFIPAAPRLLLARRFPVSGAAILCRHTATTAAPPPVSPNKTIATAPPALDSAAALVESAPEPPADLATSAYSPVLALHQKRDEGAALDAASVSGAPLDLQARTVRIHKPSKAATQSGNWNGRQWRMDWDVLPRGATLCETWANACFEGLKVDFLKISLNRLQMGKWLDGMAVQRRFHAGNSRFLQNQGGCDTIR